MENKGRVNLVTRFCCATCGDQLELSHKVNEETKQKPPDYLSDKITGADKVEINIWIEPCKICVRKPLEQLNTLRKILKEE